MCTIELKDEICNNSLSSNLILHFKISLFRSENSACGFRCLFIELLVYTPLHFHSDIFISRPPVHPRINSEGASSFPGFDDWQESVPPVSTSCLQVDRWDSQFNFLSPVICLRLSFDSLNVVNVIKWLLVLVEVMWVWKDLIKSFINEFKSHN